MGQAGKMSGKKHALSLAFLLLLIVFTFTVLLKDIGIKGLCLAIGHAQPGYLVLGLSLMLVFFFCEGEAIRMIVKSLGHPVKHWQGFVYACVDFYFSAITPSSSGGQPVCLYYMSKDHVPVAASGLAMLLQTVVYKLVLIGLGIWVLIMESEWFKSGNWGVQLLFWGGFVINLIVIATCLLAMFSKRVIQKLALWVIRIGAKIRLVKDPEGTTEKLFHSLEEYAQGAVYIRTHYLMVLRVFAVTVVQRLAMFSIAYWVYLAMGLGEYGLFDMIALQTLIAMSIDSLPLPGGMGASEGVFSMLYYNVYGPDLLVPGLVVTRGINYYLGLIISSIVVIANQSRIVRGEKNRASKPE